MHLRSFGAATLLVVLVTSCASGAQSATTSTTDRTVSPLATQPSVTGNQSPTTMELPPTTLPPTTLPPTTLPPTTLPPTKLPPIPTPLATGGTPAEQAVVIVDALTNPDIDRDPAVLAAFTGANLPVVLADGSSLTTSRDDPFGFPWAIVSSATSLSSPKTRLSLTELVGLFRLADPSRRFDVALSANELVAGLRAALNTPDGGGPTFLAHLVAEEARRYKGVELSDPAIGPDQIFIESTVAMMLSEAAFRAVLELMTERGELPVPPGAHRTATGGPSRAAHSTSPALDDNPGCDDGQGGWLLWLASKFATGANIPGYEWKGIYTTFAEFGVARGVLSTEAIDATKAIGKGSAIAGALVNVALFQAQLSTRHGHATMNGEGPLIRTKTTRDGSARTITLTIAYGGGDPEQEQIRNCILASLAFAGNNAQAAIGVAGNVEVDTTGELGFTKNLVTTGTLVLFGPDTFRPTQTADDEGRIMIPVQGRGQNYNKSKVTDTIDKQFSLYFEASLDPVTASTLGRAMADTGLCFGTVGSGNAVDGVAECQNAVIDIVKQFHWDLGEFLFPLTDWDDTGYSVHETVFPYIVTGRKCGGVGGTWDLYMHSATSQFEFDGILLGEIDEQTLTGPFTFEGSAWGAGIEVPVTGSGTITFIQNTDGTAELSFDGAVFGPRGAGAESGAPFSVPVVRDEDCEPL